MDVAREDVVTSKLSRVASLFFGVPLAVTPDRANQIRGFLVARMRGERPSAIELVGDMPGGGPLTVAVDQDGIALVSLRGTLTPKAMDGVDALSGLVSHEKLAATLGDLTQNGAVRGVVIAMDSPGGAVMGITESVAAMRALVATKPVMVAADHMIASGGFWVAAPATRIFASETSVLGSIGSLIVRHDATAADEKAGDRFEFISNMGRKGDGDEHKAISAEEIAAKRAIITQADAMFFANVAEARPINIAAIKRLDGAALMGQAAVDAGLADEIGTVADAMAAMRKRLNVSTNNGRRLPAMGGAARAEGGITMDDKTDTAAPAAADTTAKVVPINPDDPRIKAALDEATAKATQEAHEVVALCASFRCPERANAFLAAKQTREQVFAVLQAELVAKDAALATSGAHAGGDAEKPQAKLDPEKYDTHWNAALAAAHAARQPALVVG